MGKSIRGVLNFFHPISGCVQGLGLTQPGIHACKTDAGGNFSFSFTISGSWSEYADVTLLVTQFNDGCSLVLGPDQSYILSPAPACWTIVRTFRDYTTLSINSDYWINYQNVDITNIDPNQCALLRNTEFAKEFVHNRFGILLPIFTSNVDVNTSTEFDAGEGWYQPYTCDAEHVGHEYGHYLHSQLNHGTNFYSSINAPCYLNGGHNFVEGFAELHSFCVRNYISSVYGDLIDLTYKNSEEMPFYTNPRFNGTYGNNPEVGAASCFIWNIYDDYSNAPYRASQYDGGENDDIGDVMAIDYINQKFWQLIN